MVVDVLGEHVSITRQAWLALADRIFEVDPDSELAAGVVDGDGVVTVPADEITALRGVLGRWHADEGVLRAELRLLLDALGAAELRRSLVRADS